MSVGNPADNSCILPIEGIPKLICYLVPYLIIGDDVLIARSRDCSVDTVCRKFSYAVATVGATVLGEYTGRGSGYICFIRRDCPRAMRSEKVGRASARLWIYVLIMQI